MKLRFSYSFEILRKVSFLMFSDHCCTRWSFNLWCEGSYSSSGASSCSTCPAGQTCTASGVITDCDAGKFSGDGQSDCTNCQSGKKC
jgi:hypothetical protein